MLSTFVEGYFYSLAAFWTAAVRIGLPHILLLVLLFCWLRRRRRGGGCCWSFGAGSESCCCRLDPCCCRRETCDAEAGDDGDNGRQDADAHHDADHDQD